MNKIILSLAVSTFFLTACNDSITAGGEKENTTQKTTAETTNTTNNNQPTDFWSITGKYASNEGDLEITSTEGMVLFKLLVVSAEGRTGDLEGEMTLKQNTGIYINEPQDCNLQFKFTDKQVEITQKGMCEMGLGVTASSAYKSVSEANASSN
ncbi:MAG: hypothetical protein DRQ78_06970 [Epsilonproteobacteria bacterium]|nr:MAG: hypothetical protein DRQ78_06970 [Campylobacterota bacterium]